MGLPSVLEPLLKDAGYELDLDSSSIPQCEVRLACGGVENIMFLGDTGAPEELQAIVIAISIHKFQNSLKRVHVGPLPSGLPDDMLIANAEGGVGAFALANLNGAIRDIRYLMTVSLKRMDSKTFQSIIAHFVEMADWCEGRLNSD